MARETSDVMIERLAVAAKIDEAVGDNKHRTEQNSNPLNSKSFGKIINYTPCFMDKPPETFNEFVEALWRDGYKFAAYDPATGRFYDCDKYDPLEDEESDEYAAMMAEDDEDDGFGVFTEEMLYE